MSTSESREHLHDVGVEFLGVEEMPNNLAVGTLDVAVQGDGHPADDLLHALRLHREESQGGRCPDRALEQPTSLTYFDLDNYGGEDLVSTSLRQDCSWEA